MVRDFFSKLLRREISSLVRISVTVAPRHRAAAGIRPLPFDLISSWRRPRRHTPHRDQEMRPSMWPRYVSLDHGPQLHAVMHLQIIRADRQLTGRYVANWPHRWTMWIGLTEKPRCGRNWPSGWMLSVRIFGPRGIMEIPFSTNFDLCELYRGL